MEHLALYRKYRPKDFSEVIGQDHITKTLSNQILNNNISHAYLFCGTRGTGKTSIAKIFARAINCPNNLNGSPCNNCEVCNSLKESNNVDIFEIDAASNNGVENVREIRDKVKYPAVVGKYKVYIIDEVHMLSDSAFNALLKTLEEPPAHVVFILATTEVQKLPATILSRCLKFDFKLVSNSSLENLLTKIFDKENVKYDKESISLLAKNGEGSVRDTLSLADMCVAYTNKNISYSAVLDALGTTNQQILKELSSCILNKNAKNLLLTINNICANGKNIPQVCKDLVNFFRDITIVKTCDDYSSILQLPEEQLETLKSLANITTIDNLLNILQKLSGLEQEFRYTKNARSLFEILLLSLIADDSKLTHLENKITELEKKLNTMVLP